MHSEVLFLLSNIERAIHTYVNSRMRMSPRSTLLSVLWLPGVCCLQNTSALEASAVIHSVTMDWPVLYTPILPALSGDTQVQLTPHGSFHARMTECPFPRCSRSSSTSGVDQLCPFACDTTLKVARRESTRSRQPATSHGANGWPSERRVLCWFGSQGTSPARRQGSRCSGGGLRDPDIP